MAGGSILTGVLKLGDEIEIRPGVVTKDAEGRMNCIPIFSRIVTLFAEQNDLKFAVPGGLIGIPPQIPVFASVTWLTSDRGRVEG